jgi:uncharacterized protein YfiM (DUF2279 family)
MMAAIALLVSLSAEPDTSATRSLHPLTLHRAPGTSSRARRQQAAADRWFATDKVKHFFMSALIQSSAYSLARSADVSRSNAQVVASVVSVGFGVAKEIRDRRQAKVFSVKDLVWDGAGALTAAALLNGTR